MRLGDHISTDPLLPMTTIPDPSAPFARIYKQSVKATKLQPPAPMLCFTMVLQHKHALCLPCMNFSSSSGLICQPNEDWRSLNEDASVIAHYYGRCTLLKLCLSSPCFMPGSSLPSQFPIFPSIHSELARQDSILQVLGYPSPISFDPKPSNKQHHKGHQPI